MYYILPGKVAEILQIPENSVRRLARNGQLPAIKLGVLWRFDEVKVLRYLDQQCSNQ